jgi:predicted NBD/HSP70 family sugar kinase
MLRERYRVPVQVANDSRAAALALQLFGERQSRTANLVAITVGRGIGAGVVLRGELFHGDGFGAGEIGHTTVVQEGPKCRCGRIGCLETVASSRALLRQAIDAAEADPDGFLGARLADTGQLRLTDLVAGLEGGDEATIRIVTRAGTYLGEVIGGLIGVLDVQRIVLHGSVTVLGTPWLDAVRAEARRRSFPPLSAHVRIDIAAPLGDLVVMGASALLLTSELGLAAGRAA